MPQKKLTCLTDVGTGCGDVTWLLPALGSCWFFIHLVQPTVECRLGDVVLRPSCSMPLCLFPQWTLFTIKSSCFCCCFFCCYSLEISNYQLSYHRPLSVHWGSKITPSFLITSSTFELWTSQGVASSLDTFITAYVEMCCSGFCAPPKLFLKQLVWNWLIFAELSENGIGRFWVSSFESACTGRC